MAWGDEFETQRERKEAFPTMAAYCRSRDDEGLARLIWDRLHQRNVFGTYNGTVGDYAMTIIREAKSR